MLFSATFPPLIQRLSRDVLNANNVMISNQKNVSTNSRVFQNFIPVIQKNKKAKLLEILKKDVEMAQQIDRKLLNYLKINIFSRKSESST